MVREVLPNVLPAMFSIALLGIAVVIVAEGGLAILGVERAAARGVVGQRSSPTAQSNLQNAAVGRVRAVVFIFLTVLSLNYLGDVVRARFDVRESVAVSPRRRRRGRRPLRRRAARRPAARGRRPAHRLQDRPRRSCTRSTASRSRSSGARRSASSASRAAASRCCRARSWACCRSNVDAARQHPVRGPRDRRRRRRRRCASYWGTQMAMVFQDPMTSLNPVMQIGKQITESLRYHLDVSKDYANETALALLQSVGIPEAERRLQRVPAPALGRHAPARDDRDRARVRPEAAVRRRADDRARRHRAGADPRPAAGAAARAVHGDDPRHPRPRRRRRPHRRHRGDVRGPDRREGADALAVQRDAAPVHRGAAEVDPEARAAEPHPARRDQRPPARPRQPAARAASSRRAARTRRRSASPRSRRSATATTPGHVYRCFFPVGTEAGKRRARRATSPRARPRPGTPVARRRAVPSSRARLVA